MLTDRISSLIKTHTATMAVFMLYVLMWLTLYLYIAFDRFAFGTAHYDRVNYLLLLAFLFTLPYMIILMIMAVLNDKYRKFYFRLSLMILAPMVISVLLGALDSSAS